MTLPREIKPQDCPEPQNHDVFRYCPACSWTEDYGKPVKRPITVEVKVPETEMTYSVGDSLTLGRAVAQALRDYASAGGDLVTWTLTAEGYELNEGTGVRLTVTGLSIDEVVPDPVQRADEGPKS